MLTTGNSKSVFASLLIGVLSVAAQAADSAADQPIAEVAQEHETIQHQVREQSGNTPDQPGNGQQRNANSEQKAEHGPEVKEGPYGDKQNHRRQGSPDVAGDQTKPQKGQK
jgi:hypothetical protein